MKALTFQIHLHEPVLIASLSGDPNSSVGLDFIPGSTIRGLLIRRYLQGCKGDAGNNEFRRLFLSCFTRFLNAYPKSRNGIRTLPTPLSWHFKKDEEKPVYDLVLKEKGDESWSAANKGQPFCYSWEDEEDNGRVEFYKPNYQINIHTANENRQRSAKENSTVFRYQALASGQDFCAAILADDESDLEKMFSLLPSDLKLSIGGSHSAGYGLVNIDKVKIDEWYEYQPLGDDPEKIVITLLSNALVRNNHNGTYTLSLESILGCKDELAFVKSAVVGGFNRTWNLPLAQGLAIQAGSVFVYKYDPEIAKRLNVLEETGIGERLAEGFGRIAINWHNFEEISIGKYKASPPLPETVSGPSKELARRMAQRLLRSKLDFKLVEIVNQLSIDRRRKLTKTQISRMRLSARLALSKNDPGEIINHLNGMKRTAREQFQDARISGKSLWNWIEERAREPQSVWELLNMREDGIPAVGGIKPELRELALEYTVFLIDRVLQKASREGGDE
jgi:CRISPR-associated protein Csx10